MFIVILIQVEHNTGRFRTITRLSIDLDQKMLMPMAFHVSHGLKRSRKGILKRLKIEMGIWRQKIKAKRRLQKINRENKLIGRRGKTKVQRSILWRPPPV